MAIKDWFKRINLGGIINAPFSWWKNHEAMNGEYVLDYFTAVKILAENIAKMTPIVKDGNNKEMKDHTLTGLFSHKPNSFTNRQKFMHQAETIRCDIGDSFIWIDRGSNGKPKNFYQIQPNSVSGAKLTTAGLFYEVDFGNSPMVPKIGTEDIRGEDILHYTFGNKKGLFGTRALDVAGGHTSVLSRAVKMIDTFYANNATSAMAIETTIDRASVAARQEEAQDDFIEKYVGEEKAGKPIRLPPNTKLVPIHQKFVDAQVIETQKHSREEIANLFGIPKYMFESTESNDSIEQQTRMFLAFTLSPIIEMYVAEMEFKLLTAEEIKAGVHIDFNTEKMIETDFKTQVDIVAIQVAKGIMSPDEGAIKLGNEPIGGEWGNKHFIQSQNNPIENYGDWGNNNLNQNVKPNEKQNEEDRKVQPE